MRSSIGILCISSLMMLASCATPTQQGTLAELSQVEPDVEEVYLGDSLERAADSYRRYLEETTESARTPEAMRRLADLQIEEQYGLIGGKQAVASEHREMAAPAEMTAPDKARLSTVAGGTANQVSGPTESQQDFEQRASERDALLQRSELESFMNDLYPRLTSEEKQLMKSLVLEP